MSVKKPRNLSTRHASIPAIITIISLMFILLGVSNPGMAQDGIAEVTVEPSLTDVPTEQPTIPPTEMPTQEATEVTPTETVIAPTTEPTAMPTVASAPPVFNLLNGTSFETQADMPLVFQFTVSDEAGIVSVVADSAGTSGFLSVSTIAPVETVAPYHTLVTVTYTAAAGFSGVDTFMLVAMDRAAISAAATFTVNVIPVVEPLNVTPTSPPVPVKEVLINYDPAASEDSIQAMLAGLSAVELSRIPQIGVLRVQIPETLSAPAVAMSTLQSNGTGYLAGVKAIESNGEYYLTATTDADFGLQWGLKNVGTGSPTGIDVEGAWLVSTTRGMGITVAVLDGGVDLQQPDLANQLVAGWDFANDDNNPDDDTYVGSVPGHGTHIAGIIAARTNNLTGIAGIAYNAKIMPVKVCKQLDPLPGDPPIPQPAPCGFFHIAGGIVHAVDKGAKVINLSLGSTTPSSTVEAAINYALSRNVVVVAAAGNNGDNLPFYPAYYPGVISVGAYDAAGNKPAFSNSNDRVNISAPGAGIHSTLPIEMVPSYGTKDGTSMATAHVSGVVALILSAKVATTPQTVLEAITCGAQGVGTLDASYPQYGRLNAYLSMNWNLNSKSCKVTQPNDNFETPKVITTVPFTSTQPVHSRSVTVQTTDPATICGVATLQTLWFSYRPSVSSAYQINTLGSSYDSVFGIYQGSAGALSQVGCSTDVQHTIALQAAQTYYIVVGTNEAAVVDDQVLQLSVNSALPANKVDYQENAVYFAYSGMWVRSAVTGAAGGYIQQTTDVNAAVAFSFRGTEFEYARTVGPDRGQVLIYINNEPPMTVDNRAAIMKTNQFQSIVVPNGTSGQWNIVRIVRDATVPGIIDLDRVKTYDFDKTTSVSAFSGKADDRDNRLRYTAGWTNVSVATTVAYLGTLKETNDPAESLTFRMTGSSVTLFRMTGQGYAPMQVLINNGTPITIDDTGGSDAVRPYTIDGLVTMEHVVEIRKIGTNSDGLIIRLDAVQAATLGSLTSGTTYDERVTNLAYRGNWTDNANVLGANLKTTRSLAANTEVSFNFVGNDLCVGYERITGSLEMHIDGTLYGTISADNMGGFVSWCLNVNGNKLVSDGTHYVKLVVPSGSTFRLDSIRPQRYNTLTPARGLVQENDPSLIYKTPTNWITLITKSVGGYAPQGGSYRESSTDNETITFYINGTGFILYTFMGPSRGCLEIQVDGSPYDTDPTTIGIQTPLDLNGNGTEFVRDQPLGYGVVGLTPGIHKIVLLADSNCGIIPLPPQSPPQFLVDFDAIRVFP